MAKIQTIKNKDDIIVYPQTHSEAVFVKDGTKLQDKIDKYLTAEEQTSIEDTESTFEVQENKTTIINSDSTDTEYPSAKAVYEAIHRSINAGFKIEVITEGDKPAIGVVNTIYLVAINSEEVNNTYEEWLYVNDKWELIGTTEVDLSTYATKDMLTEYVKQEVLTNYATTLSVDTKLADYATTTAVNGLLENYSTTTAADNKYTKLEKYGDTTIDVGRKENTTKGDFSSAVGTLGTATGYAASTEGVQTTAYGTGAHAEGAYTIANNNFTHAEGYSTIALADYSHTEGQGTQSSKSHSHVQGKFNKIDENKEYLHIVGNGTAEDARSNAHTIKENGEAWFSGDVYVGSTSGVNKDEGSKKLATEEYVNNNKVDVSNYYNKTEIDNSFSAERANITRVDRYNTPIIQLVEETIQKDLLPKTGWTEGVGTISNENIICEGVPGSTSSDYKIGKAFDGDINTCASIDNFSGIIIDFGKAYKITKFKTAIAVAGTIYGSNDKNIWNTIGSYKNGSSLTESIISNPDYYRYYKLNSENVWGGSVFNVYEIQVSEYINGYNLITLNNSILEYFEGQRIFIDKAEDYNETLASYININNLGNKSIEGQLVNGKQYELWYNGNNFEIINKEGQKLLNLSQYVSLSDDVTGSYSFNNLLNIDGYNNFKIMITFNLDTANYEYLTVSINFVDSAETILDSLIANNSTNTIIIEVDLLTKRVIYFTGSNSGDIYWKMLPEGAAGVNVTMMNSSTDIGGNFNITLIGGNY